MKKCLFVCFGILFLASLSAQDKNTPDWDIDSVFDAPDPAASTAAESDEASKTSSQTTDIAKIIQRRGYTFGVNYTFIAGVAPGWYETPGTPYWDKSDYYLYRYITMISSFSLDAQISEDFRVINNISYQIPGTGFVMGDFFFDYKLYNTVFFRAGKYNMSWGISPNYGFTNLLIRVPKDAPNGDSYIFKADVPVGNGGFQVLTMTRINLADSNVTPKISDFGYGGKYNFAHRFIDLDIGFFTQKKMPYRGFLSLKTTVKKIELYNEWVAAVDRETHGIDISFNAGFAVNLFNKLDINGEFYYNGEGEKDSYWYQRKTEIKDAASYSFINGANIALNIQYKPWSKGNPRLFLQARYIPAENSAQLIPGFILTPWKHVDFCLSAPMGIGNRDGYYYNNTVNYMPDKNTGKDKPLPFAVIFSVRVSGGVSFGHYY